jgi:hypothetical protein
MSSTATYRHPSFPQPENPLISIWRYMDFFKFEWMVKNNRLFMVKANQFKDPFEGTTPKGDQAWWQQQAKSAKSSEERDNLLHNEKFLSQAAENIFRDKYYISCWHMNEHESPEMWKLYASNTESVAIRVAYGTLKNLLASYVEMGIVRYIDYAKDRLPLRHNMYDYIMHKRLDYQIEREVRAVALCPIKIVDQEGYKHFSENYLETQDAFTPQIDLSKLIMDVVLNPNSDAEFKKKISNICESNKFPKPENSSTGTKYSDS